jgi:hypothetical protein
MEINKDYCIEIIQSIVNKTHKHPEKRRIIISKKDVQFAEPIYGDSLNNPKQKRCHLYWDTMYVVSYDDQGYKMPFIDFCKKFDISLDFQQRHAINIYMDENQVHKNDTEEDYISTTLDKIIDLDVFIERINSGETNSPISELKPVEKNSVVWKYLMGRNIKNFEHIYQCKYSRTIDWSEPCILILNKRGNKLLGAQIRNLKSGKYRMFKVYNFEQLNTWTYPDRILPENELMKYNKISYYFNIMNVDFSKPVTIFEGYLDAIFLKNSIGITGLNTDLSFFENNKDLDIRYFFDNDKPGYIKSASKIKDGFSVFLWQKLFEFIVKGKNPNDPYDLYYRISKVKDLNSLAQLVDEPEKTLNLSNFFSKDIYDLRNIPKIKKKL